MDVGHSQFTIRRMLLAVGCFAMAAALLSAIAHPIGVPAPYGDYEGFFVLTAIVTVYVGVYLLCGRRIQGTGRIKAICITIVCWEVLCFGLYFFYYDIGGRLVTGVYQAYVGDPQASYGTYARVVRYVGIVTMTTPATVMSLCLFNVLSHRKWQWKPTLLMFIGWQVCVVGILIWSYENGFGDMVHDIGRLIFGLPDNLYSFLNLGLPGMVAWVICTAPIAWVTLCLHQLDENAPLKNSD